MRIECRTCHHTLRENADTKTFHHSGPRAKDCTCACEGRTAEEIPDFRELKPSVRGAKKAKQDPEAAGGAPLPGPGVWAGVPVASATPADEPVPPAPPAPTAQVTDAEAIAAGVPKEVIATAVTSVGITLSNSEFRTWKRCRRKWYLAYYRRLHLKVEAATGPAPLGTRVHAALAAYYSMAPVNPYEVLRAGVAADMERCPDRIEDIQKEAELAQIMLEGYFQWVQDEGIDEGLKIVGDEVEIGVDIPIGTDGTVIHLICKLDVRVLREVDGARFFIDHKTVGDLVQPARMLPMDEQMLTYHLVERLLPNEEGYAAGGMYNMLRKVKRTVRAKPPFYDRIEVHHNPHELRNFWTRLQGEALDIIEKRRALDVGANHQLVVYPNPTKDCSWDCQFYPVCPLMDDGSASEELMMQFYQEGNPYARYDSEEEPAGA